MGGGTFAVPRAAAHDHSLAHAQPIVSHDGSAQDAYIVQHGIGAIRVIVSFAGILLHAQPGLQVAAVLQLVAQAVVERVAGIAVGHLIALAVIERDVGACRECAVQVGQQLPGLAVGRRGRTGIDEEGEAAACGAVEEGDEAQLAQRLHGAVQIDVGMYLLYLGLVEEGQALEVRYGGRVDVHGLLVDGFQLLEPQCPLLVLGLLLVGGIFIEKVVPGVGIALGVSLWHGQHPGRDGEEEGAQSGHSVCMVSPPSSSWR